MSTPCPDTPALAAAVVGGGCAGLTLAHRLAADQNGPVAVIDPGDPRPDHIWGYWDDGGEDLALARPFGEAAWRQWAVIDHGGKTVLTGNNFWYRAISSARFENHLRATMPAVRQMRGTVAAATRHAGGYRVALADGRELRAARVFDSRPPAPPAGVLLQHFAGWQVRMDQPVFDPHTAILMDFRVSQEAGVHFIYLLPFSAENALVESTVFSPQVQPASWYDDQIAIYLAAHYPTAGVTISSREAGVIPLARLRPYGVFGTAVGMRADALRASSGYAFSQIQRQIADLTVRGGGARPGCDAIEAWMDQVLVRVLRRAPARAPEIFTRAAAALDGDAFARFMRGYGDWPGRLRLMSGLPMGLFLVAALGGAGR